MATSEEKDQMERACEALRAGEIGDGAFLRLTGDRWRRTACYLWGHWRRKLPAWVEPEDVEQELLVQAVKYVRKWDPERSRRMPIGVYVVWSAIKRAQREMNGWRGATKHGNSGTFPSRGEVTFSRAFGPDVDPFARLGSTEATQDEALARAERLAVALGVAETTAEVVVLRAIWAADGSARGAARLIAEDLAARLEVGAATAGEAYRAILRIARTLADRMGVAVEDLSLEGGAEEGDEEAAEEYVGAMVASAAA
jgi:hypothetical protein